MSAAQERVLGYLGIAARGGRLASGDFAAEKAVREGRCRLLVLAGDASPNTVKKFSALCGRFGVPVVTCADRDTLGARIGKERRAAVAVTDEKLAEAIKALL